MSGGLVLPGAVSETALDLPKSLSFDDWERVGRTLGQIERACQWWIGDWVNFGEQAYGEKYAQAVEATGLEYNTVATYAWVAREIESSTRVENLSFSHHREVAHLERPKQKAWLIKAQAGEWSRSHLADEVRGRANGSEPEEVCPHCHRPMPRKAS